MSNAAYTRRGTDPASEPLLNADEGQQQQRQGQQQQQQQESGQLPLHAGGGAANGDGQPDTMAGIVKYSNFTGSAWAVQVSWVMRSRLFLDTREL